MNGTKESFPGMSGSGRIVVVVRPGANARRSRQVVAWIRALLPAAILLVGAGTGSAPTADVYDAITLDVDSVESGPLSLADALARFRRP